MMNKAHLLLLTLVFSCCYVQLVATWGERGHDIVTRVAVQQLKDTPDLGENLSRPFVQRAHMLSHFSNVPDIVWRASDMSRAERDANYPTHYINLERVYPELKGIEDIDVRFSDFERTARQKKIKDPASVGTAPWRILQLHQLMTDSFRQVSAAKSKETKVEMINQALLYAGIMSHFVGDLANPHHTSVNHNGQLTGNTGLHAYFESDVVTELPLNLIANVNAMVNSTGLQSLMPGRQADQSESRMSTNPEQLVFALVFDSLSKVSELTQLDNDFAIVEKSTNERDSAQRKSTGEVAHHFQGFVTERLAIGAAVLSYLWIDAWQQAGSPDLSDYQSYDYPVKPAFIYPDYLGG